MPEIREIIPLSEWLTFNLQTKLVVPPVVKFKLRPITDIEMMDEIGTGRPKLSRYLIERAIEAIAEWDLTIRGEPIPVTDETKHRHLPLLLSMYIEPEQEKEEPAPPEFLAVAVVNYARNLENFLKN